MADEIYIGDVGVNIKYTIKNLTTTQLNAITVSQFHIITPAGVHSSVVATRNGKILSYSSIAGTLPVKGWYEVIPYIETSFGLQKHLDKATFEVLDPNA